METSSTPCCVQVAATVRVVVCKQQLPIGGGTTQVDGLERTSVEFARQLGISTAVGCQLVALFVLGDAVTPGDIAPGQLTDPRQRVQIVQQNCTFGFRASGACCAYPYDQARQAGGDSAQRRHLHLGVEAPLRQLDLMQLDPRLRVPNPDAAVLATSEDKLPAGRRTDALHTTRALVRPSLTRQLQRRRNPASQPEALVDVKHVKRTISASGVQDTAAGGGR
mmetsp:Transcript_44561/g.115300  ORF Transcript_44561/g.115300 Transcript_44561/m.115300 type:complete len:222 (-) Transcript_44561:100-765(-)